MDPSNSNHSFPFPPMEDATAYFCVARGAKILHSAGADGGLDAFAALCIQNAPNFHSWHFHTDSGRTVGFLFDDGYTFFAIVAPTVGSPAALHLLQTVRDGFKKNQLVPALRTLIASLEPMSRLGQGVVSSEMLVSMSTNKAPLLGRNSSRVTRDRAIEPRKSFDDFGGGGGDRPVKIDIKMETTGPIPLQKSLSSMKSRGQLSGQRLWWRYVKIVALADALLCLILFGVWLGICRGFQCVSSS